MNSPSAVLPNSLSWSEVRFRYLASTAKGRLPQKEEEESLADEESHVPYLSMEYIRGEDEARNFVPSKGMLLALDADVILLWDGSNAGEFFKAKFGAISSTTALVRPYYLTKNYLFWVCKAVEPILKTFTNGMGIPHVDGEFLSNLRLPLAPEKKTQQLIANYLDRETARIDALIAGKESMLALLEEKRTALVSQSVTRGLNPNAPLKPSGLDWLDDIPVGWEVMRLKFLLRGIDQGNSPQCHSFPAEVGEWGVLKTGCVNGGVFRERENKALPNTIEPYPESEVRINDVLMSRASGSVDLIGSVAYVSSQPFSRLLLSDKIYRFRTHPEIIQPAFIVYVMGSSYLRHQIKSVISGAEGLANNIAKSDILEFSIIVPPLKEQEEISTYIENKISKNSLISEALTTSIALLKERRAALITAAITGQIPGKEMAA